MGVRVAWTKRALREPRDPACRIHTHSRFHADRTPHCSTVPTSDKLEEKQPGAEGPERLNG